MSLTPRELRNEIMDGLRSLRLTFDRKATPLELEDRVRLAGTAERIRVVARQSSMGTSRFFFKDELSLLLNLLRELRELVASQPALSTISAVAISQSDRTTSARFIKVGVTNYDLLDFLVNTIEEIPPLSVVDAKDIQLAFDGEPSRSAKIYLAKVVPEQKISPVHFDISNNVLKIEHFENKAKLEDVDNIFAARTALIEQGRKVLDELGRSNCDRRFLSDVNALQEKLETSQDIIQLGILNISCEDQRRQVEAELPEVVASKLRSHFGTIAMYVAQFQDWARFAENAAAVELNEADVRRSQSIALEIATKFDEMPETVSTEVPTTIRLLSHAISDPARASKRVSFALVRTIENLFIRIFGYAAKFVDESASKLISVGSKAVAIGFGAAILDYAGRLVSIYDKLPGMGWLKPAVEIFHKFLVNQG
ncbi:hypothetical protein ATY78_11675 [Rhizobium sp. R635]|uniref:hypothetical protein n=1 Tax=Rhizobium sp. R635 TaxID=1764275 RepID=UPI000B534EBA|nr:hypothetical protein [Rhizobium sp. R635]OWV78758.1 hypothetical protein ATY78_11675 [Rhizobium sp. R635]